MLISQREISPMQPALIIAEIGINHGGQLDEAKRLVEAAAEAGAECVKHQTHFVEDEMTVEAKHIFPPNADKSIWEVIESCALGRDDEVALMEFSKSLGLIYLSTPFSRSAADFLHEIDVPAFKIGSGENDNLLLLEHIVRLGRPIILSTGMQDLNSLRPAVDILKNHSVDYCLLECTNMYPCPPENVSLKGLSDLRQAFDTDLVGFSDHSAEMTMALSALALGSVIVEKHFTDSKDRIGPDISSSMDASELRNLIRWSKEIHYALGNTKKREPVEEAVYRFARSSLVADQDIKKGDKFNKENLWARRPGNGEIAGFEVSDCLGKAATRNIARGEQIKRDDVGEV